MSAAGQGMAVGKSARVFDLTGGRTCLDFANTVEWRPSERREEMLESYADLVAWARQAAVLTVADARHLLGAASRRPRAAEAVLARAKELRDVLYRIFSAVAAEEEPTPQDSTALDAHLHAALQRACLTRVGGQFVWAWIRAPKALDRMLWPVVRDAVEFLTRGDVPRLRECAADDCAWLFLDQSRNGSRVWCNMQVCGNRQKARRHYARVRRRSGLQRGRRLGPV